MTNKQKIYAYIDGFNLYYALKDKNWQRFYWLNLWLFAENLLAKNQELRLLKYFTSDVTGTTKDPQKPQRQQTYLAAIKTLSDTKIIKGSYILEPKLCPVCQTQLYCLKCKIPIEEHTEKKTDVNIAVELLTDSYANAFDTALLITGDSDLSPAVEKAIKIFNKRVVVAFPPNRNSNSLAKAASYSFIIGRGKFSKSQFPDTITRDRGTDISRPSTWQ